MLSKTSRVVLNVAAMLILSLWVSAASGAANPVLQKMATKPATAPPAGGAADEAALSADLRGVKVAELMSQMTDEQVRRLLLEKLREEALKEADLPPSPGRSEP